MNKPLAFIASAIAASVLAAAVMTPTIVRGSSSPVTPGKEKESANSKAIIKSKPQPNCPEETKKRLAATIVLRAIFTSSGKVTDIYFYKVIPDDLPADIVKPLTEKTIEAARLIKFKPAIKDGHPVSMYMQLEYNFECK